MIDRLWHWLEEKAIGRVFGEQLCWHYGGSFPPPKGAEYLLRLCHKPRGHTDSHTYEWVYEFKV